MVRETQTSCNITVRVSLQSRGVGVGIGQPSDLSPGPSPHSPSPVVAADDQTDSLRVHRRRHRRPGVPCSRVLRRNRWTSGLPRPRAGTEGVLGPRGTLLTGGDPLSLATASLHNAPCTRSGRAEFDRQTLETVTSLGFGITLAAVAMERTACARPTFTFGRGHVVTSLVRGPRGESACLRHCWVHGGSG